MAPQLGIYANNIGHYGVIMAGSLVVKRTRTDRQTNLNKSPRREADAPKYCTLYQDNTILSFVLCVISGFRLKLDICALPRCYAAYSGDSLPTFRDKISVPP